MMPKLRTDKGAIKFVLSGANIMCPGLTSPGATIHTEVKGQRHDSGAVTHLGHDAGVAVQQWIFQLRI
jgi:predicted RNA-binding protein (TIGR00451 family)